MIAGTLLALSFALAPLAQRYRVEIAGVPVGWAAAEVACDAAGCTLDWRSALRTPEPGSEVLRREIEARAAPDGAAAWVRARVDGREVRAGPGPAPASLAEWLLSRAGEGERRCVTVRDEVTGEVGPACATRGGEWLEGEVLGVALRFRARSGALPDEVLVPAQRARFVADPAAALPATAPRLFGAEVARAPGASLGGPLRFCGRDAEPPPAAGSTPAAAVPREFPDGAHCREKTARYLAAARRAGIDGREVVGVAWDGQGFAWHAWAELFTGGQWLPVDPSFRQLPARGPRFALARYAPTDEAARQAAGRAILACWGRADVEAQR